MVAKPRSRIRDYRDAYGYGQHLDCEQPEEHDPTHDRWDQRQDCDYDGVSTHRVDPNLLHRSERAANHPQCLPAATIGLLAAFRPPMDERRRGAQTASTSPAVSAQHLKH